MTQAFNLVKPIAEGPGVWEKTFAVVVVTIRIRRRKQTEELRRSTNGSLSSIANARRNRGRVSSSKDFP
jgi:hypothetical protein